MAAQDDLLSEIRHTNSILKLAFAPQIGASMQQLLVRPSLKSVMAFSLTVR